MINNDIILTIVYQQNAAALHIPISANLFWRYAELTGQGYRSLHIRSDKPQEASAVSLLL